MNLQINPGGAPAPGQPPLITPYAQKYGVVDYSYLPLLANSNSSGIAPRLRLPLTRMEYFLEMGLERSQREQLNGFTTQELVDLGAHGRRDMKVKPCNLRNPIHPIFDPGTQWVSTLVPHDVGNGWGKWDVGNLGVWRAVEPCFWLATRFIESSYLHSWFTALLFGELKVIPGHRFGGGVNTGYPNYFASFHNVERNVSAEEVLAMWHRLTYHIAFAFSIQPVHIGVRGITKSRRSRNCTYLPPIKGVIGAHDARIELNINIFSPLLYNISASERLITQFAAAKTIVHELCHALGIYRLQDIPMNPDQNFKNANRVPERLFYEDEFYVELGYSFENAIFGGVIHPSLPSPTYGHDLERPELSFPSVAVLLFSWPDYQRIYGEKDNTLGPYVKEVKIPLLQTPTFTPRTFSRMQYPISLSFIEDIHQEEYWQNCVPKWGADMTKVFPRIFGIRTFLDPSNPQGEESVSRHFGGKRSVDDAKVQFPSNRVDAYMRAICIHRFQVVKQLCNTLRTRCYERRRVAEMYGPVAYWDPDSDRGDTIPEVDNEEQMRDAIAAAIGVTREQLDPNLSTEFLIRYFFLTPIVPPEVSADVGDIILDFNSKDGRRFTARQFVNLPEKDMEWYIKQVLSKWGYPPNFRWREFGVSFHGVRKAREWFEEQQRVESRDREKRKADDAGVVEGPRQKRARTEMVDHAIRPMREPFGEGEGFDEYDL